jgi:UDPglucose 6-dehydrogenase
MSLLKKKGYNVTNELLEAIDDSDIVFVCVPTPTSNNQLDLTFIHSSIVAIAETLKKTRKYVVIVIRSTLLPQTTRTIIIPKLEKYSGLTAGKDFGVCMNPEFLKEKTPLDDFLNPDRIVIGEFDQKSGDVLERIYSPFNCPIVRTDLDTAEMIKYVSNLFLASKISFFNEIFMVCDSLGLDAQEVSEAVSLDSRIGVYGIYGGHPFSGKCFPKDLAAFIDFVKSKGLSYKILDAVNEVNRAIALFDTKKTNG